MAPPELQFIWCQLLSYSAPSWMLFIAIAFCAARYGKRGYWIFLGQILVAIAVAQLDALWVEDVRRARHQGPGGVPDMDMLFSFGCLFRAVLINSALLPVTALGFWLQQRKETRKSAARN